jgi:hypothetical protein
MSSRDHAMVVYRRMMLQYPDLSSIELFHIDNVCVTATTRANRHPR